MNTEQRTEPQGRLLLRTMAMPADTNPNGDIFGGWLMSQMDIAGGILAYETACGRAATVAADKIVFHRPVSVGDVVACYGELIKIGNTSMQIHIEVWVHSASFDSLNEQRLVTEALFTYVAIDKDGQPRMLCAVCGAAGCVKCGKPLQFHIVRTRFSIPPRCGNAEKKRQMFQTASVSLGHTLF